MQTPFDKQFIEIADNMGIALYGRFTLNEASLFLRSSEKDIKNLQNQGKIDHIKLTNTKTEFFGYQLLQYLLNNTTHNQTTKNPKQTQPDRIIRAKEVHKMTGLSRSTLWRMENNETFPKRINLGANSIGWRLSEIQNWIDNK